jgi:hypothetical protein
MYGAFHHMALHFDALWSNSLRGDVYVGFENDQSACFFRLTVRELPISANSLAGVLRSLRKNSPTFSICATVPTTLFPSLRADAKLITCPRKH